MSPAGSFPPLSLLPAKAHSLSLGRGRRPQAPAFPGSKRTLLLEGLCPRETKRTPRASPGNSQECEAGEGAVILPREFGESFRARGSSLQHFS